MRSAEPRVQFSTRSGRYAAKINHYAPQLELIVLTRNLDPEEVPSGTDTDSEAARVPEDDSLDRVLRKRRIRPGDETLSSPLQSSSETGDGPESAAVKLGREEPPDPAAKPAISSRTPASDLSGQSDPDSRGSRPAMETWRDSLSADRPQPQLSAWDSFRLSPAYRLAGVAVWGAAVFLLWRVGAAFLEGDFMMRVLALDAPFLPVPAPDSPFVAEASLKSAAFVGAPLALAVLWFSGAYQIDRTARRTFGFDETRDAQYPPGYVITAVLSVFPLLVLGVIGSAWGGVALATWAITHESWGPVVGLLALLGAFSLGLWLLDRGFERRHQSQRPRA